MIHSHPEDAFEPLLVSELMGGVPELLLRSLDPPPTLVHLAAGETLIRQGEQGSAFYLLVQGRLRAFVRDEKGSSRRVGEVIPGEGVGEMSLLTDQATSATVRAMHDSVLVRFSRESYLKLMAESPQAALQVMRTIIRRLKGELAQAKRHSDYRVITLLPLDGSANPSDFVSELGREICHIAPCRSVSRLEIPSPWREGILGNTAVAPSVERAIAGWVADQIEPGGIVLFLADQEPTAWTRLCLRQAHLVLLLGSPGSSSGFSQAEAGLLRCIEPELAPRTDLVLLHRGPHDLHCDTRRWIDDRPITECHHLRAGEKKDFARLARILTGKAVNLVLGGGGARGLSQIGVLRAMEELGIPVDRVGGTSMGAVIGGMFARGLRSAEIAELHRDLWFRQKLLSDYTFPAISLLRGRRLHQAAQRVFGDVQIEDLPVSFFCVSGNLTDSRLEVHDRGSLWQAVRASGSLPGAGPPMFIDGKILVDGGVLNNLPGDLMAERHSGRMIQVDVSRERTVKVPAGMDSTPSGWNVLLNRILPFREELPVPGIFEILYRAAIIGSSRAARATHRLADLLIMPPVQDYGILNLKALDQLMEIGYQEAMRKFNEPGHPFSTRK